jgi:hypothetical protein
VDEFVELQRTIRPVSSFTASLAGLVEAVLQAPDFLYRLEFGVPAADAPTSLRPSGYEMANRLSYLFLASMPDDGLLAAAASGELLTNEGIRAQATRLLQDPRVRQTTRYFFDNLLPISGLSQLERSDETFPTFSATVGAAMRHETQTFLEYQIFDGPGDWPSVFTAPYTFVNETLANFYGIAGVVGDAFQRVDLDTTKRRGLLTQGGILAGPIHSNLTNPVVRGNFILGQLLCTKLEVPQGLVVEAPELYTGATARERFALHSAEGVCSGCHSQMDPIGLALENFDAVGQWRDTENDVVIDASGSIPLLGDPFNGPVELAERVASSERVQDCFAEKWVSYGYGTTASAENACVVEQVQTAFRDSGYSVPELLVSLTQTDAFLYLNPQGE